MGPNTRTKDYCMTPCVIIKKFDDWHFRKRCIRRRHVYLLSVLSSWSLFWGKFWCVVAVWKCAMWQYCDKSKAVRKRTRSRIDQIKYLKCHLPQTTKTIWSVTVDIRSDFSWSYLFLKISMMFCVFSLSYSLIISSHTVYILGCVVYLMESLN